VTPYDSPAGTIWIHNRGYEDETYYVVLDIYTNDVPGQHPMWTFRAYLDLETGKLSHFMNKSHFANCSKVFLPSALHKAT